MLYITSVSGIKFNHFSSPMPGGGVIFGFRAKISLKIFKKRAILHKRQTNLVY